MTDCKHIISFDDLTQYLKYGQANTPFVEETELQSNGDGWAVRVPCAKCHEEFDVDLIIHPCLLYTSPSPRDGLLSRMPSSA